MVKMADFWLLGVVGFFSSVLKLGRWGQSKLASRLEHLSLFTVVDRVSDDRWLWLRWERCRGGRRSEVCFVTHGLVPLSKTQNSRSFPMLHLLLLTDPSCVTLSRRRNWVYLKFVTNLPVIGGGFNTALLGGWKKTRFSVTLPIYVRISHPVRGWLSPRIHEVSEGDVGGGRWTTAS